MNAQLNHVLARKGTVVTRLKSLQRRRRRFIARVLGTLIVLVILAVLTLSASAGTADPLGRVTEFSTGLPAGSRPEWIAAGPDGNLWFTDSGATPAIARITPSGRITEFSTGLNPGAEPNGIVAGPDGNLWFTDNGHNGAIGRITPSGQITEFANPHNPYFQPEQITAGPDGNLWFTDNGHNGAIGRITPSGQITEFGTGPNPAYPVGIAAGPDGNLWFTDAEGAIGRLGSGARPRSRRRRASPARGCTEVRCSRLQGAGSGGGVSHRATRTDAIALASRGSRPARARSCSVARP